MSMQDPIGDMLTCIRNGHAARKKIISIFYSKIKLDILNVLKEEGFIKNFEIEGEMSKKKIILKLKYYQNKSVIETIKRISRPGLRIYKKKRNLLQMKERTGIAILSTSKGIMTDRSAVRLGFGGEVICYVT